MGRKVRRYRELTPICPPAEKEQRTLKLLVEQQLTCKVPQEPCSMCVPLTPSEQVGRDSLSGLAG